MRSLTVGRNRNDLIRTYYAKGKTEKELERIFGLTG